MSGLLVFVYLLAFAATLVWPFAGLALSLARVLHRDGHFVGVARHIYHELRLFYLPAVVAYHMLGVWYGVDVSYFTLGMNLLNWVLFRNVGDDDDRWKRRRKKLADRIAAVGGRLTVVPASGGVR